MYNKHVLCIVLEQLMSRMFGKSQRAYFKSYATMYAGTKSPHLNILEGTRCDPAKYQKNSFEKPCYVLLIRNKFPKLFNLMNGKNHRAVKLKINWLTQFCIFGTILRAFDLVRKEMLRSKSLFKLRYFKELDSKIILHRCRDLGKKLKL